MDLELNQYTLQDFKQVREFFEECKKIIPLYMQGTTINGLYGKNLQLVFFIGEEKEGE